MNAIGYGVKLLDKEKCCGVPLVSNGFATQAQKHGEINMASMRKSVAEGRPILTTGTSCTLMMRNEYDHLLQIDNKVAQEHLLLETRFIYKHDEEGIKDWEALYGTLKDIIKRIDNNETIMQILG